MLIFEVDDLAVAFFGAVSEWLKEAVLKTVAPQGAGGSNPPCSVIGHCVKISG